MSKRAPATTPNKKHNVDPIKRQETIRKYFAARLKLELERDEALAKFKERGNAIKAPMIEAGFLMGDLEAPFKDYKAEQSAEKEEDRVKAANRRLVTLATYAECYEATHDGEQLDMFAVQKMAAKIKEADAEAAKRAKDLE